MYLIADLPSPGLSLRLGIGLANRIQLDGVNADAILKVAMKTRGDCKSRRLGCVAWHGLHMYASLKELCSATTATSRRVCIHITNPSNLMLWLSPRISYEKSPNVRPIEIGEKHR